MKITQKPSPNFTPGRTSKIDRIVMHWIVGNLASADATFANPKSGVSAHYAIEGNSVHQYVPESSTAWHAVQANSRSIGIEHSAQPGRDATASTLESSAQLLAQISKRHNLSLNRTTVIKHSEVVPTQCPGTIPVDSIIKRANEILKGVTMQKTAHKYLVQGVLNRPVTANDEKQNLGKEPNEVIINMVKWANANSRSYGQTVTGLSKTISAQNNRIKELEAELAVTSDDTTNLNAFGVSLRWLISRLGIK